MGHWNQTRYIGVDGAAPAGFGAGGLLGRLVALIIGLMVFGVAIFVGAIFLAAFVGLVIMAMVVVTARMWWIRRQMEKYAAEHGDLEAEYTVIREDDPRR